MPDSKDWKELLPPEGHAQVGTEAWKVLAAVVHDKENLGLPQKWQRYYELRRNKHWKSQSQGGINLVTANLIYTHMQRVVNTMTDNDPTFNIVQMDDPGASGELFGNLQSAAESWWIDTEQSDDFARTVTNGENYGICIEKVVFNPDIEIGIDEAGEITPLGEVETIIVDPFHFGVFPVKMTDPKKLQQAEAVLHFYPMSVRQVKRTWGKVADDVKPDSDLIKELGDSRREVAVGAQGQQGMLVSLANVAKTLLNWGKGNAPEDEETIVAEIWVRDRSNKAKYPGNIRRVTVCNGGKVVLEDKPNPSISTELWKTKPQEASKTYLFDKFPFSAANPIPDTSNFWGMCYDDETEILTKDRGFVPFSELTPDDEVATRNKDKKFEWQKPTHYTDYEYSGEMHHFKSRSMDLLVTPDHRMLVSLMAGKAGKRNESIVLAKDFARGLNNERRIPVTSQWDSNSELSFRAFPNPHGSTEDRILSGDDYCALLGAYLAEGNIKSEGGIEIAQKEKSKGFKLYKALAERIGSTSYNGKSFYIGSKSLSGHFKQLGLAHEKYIPADIRDLPVRQLQILWDHYVAGDGHFLKRENKSGRGKHPSHQLRISTVSRQLADNLVEIGQKLGFSVSVTKKPSRLQSFNGRISECREVYILGCRRSETMSVSEETESYAGRVYCVTVPNGIIYVRRNGKPSWCGNCDIDQIEQINIEIDKAISQMILFKDRAARQKLINPLTSGVQNEEFTNAAGIIRPVNSQEAAAIHWLGGPETNIDIQQTIQMMKDLFFLVAGTFDIDQAQVGKDVIAFKAIAALMERAATMMRGKIRSYNRMLRERGRMYLSHVMNFYTEERWITMNDPATGTMIAKRIPAGTSMIVPAKLSVVSGSTLPVSRVQRREEAIGLSEKGQIDQQALLESLDFPNRNDIIKRMQAGPMGSALQKLQAMGIPPEILDVLGQVMTMDDKEFQKVAKAGELPTFEDIVAVAMQGGGQPPDAGKQSEAMERQAKAEKSSAEAALIAEKIVTERVKQKQIMAGMQFDEETLAMERAKVVAELEHTARASEREDLRTAHEVVTGAKQNQREDARMQRESEWGEREHGREDERVGIEKEKVKSMGKNRPGFNEKGLKSNNVQA